MMNTADFDYRLPPGLIAQQPLPERSASRMMVVDRRAGAIEHRHISDLPSCLKPRDLLVLNDTRVIPARVFGRRTDTGGRVELLMVERRGAEAGNPDPETREIRPHPELWRAMWKASARPRAGMMLSLAGGKISAEIVTVGENGTISVRTASGDPIVDVLEKEGFAPLPPYIKRTSVRDTAGQADRERYQTVFARHPGAVAAPTAGLHFNQGLFAKLGDRGVRWTMVTLHVGPGTFRPVKTDRVEDHRMEEERYVISDEAVAAINDARDAGGRIVAVGSTCARTLETAMLKRPFPAAGAGRSSLFIYPPFEFKIVDAMLTNFHLPRSTLLMMVCAFAGWIPPATRAHRKPPEPDAVRSGKDLILYAYNEAIKGGYRFYSYGDAMLIV